MLDTLIFITFLYACIKCLRCSVKWRNQYIEHYELYITICLKLIHIDRHTYIARYSWSSFFIDPVFASSFTQQSLFLTSKSILKVCSWSFMAMNRMVKDLSLMICLAYPATIKQGNGLSASCWHSCYKEVFFRGLI